MLKTLVKREQARQNSKKGKKIVKLSSLKNLKIAYIPYNELIKEGIIAGIAWSIGVTIGFVLISAILVIVFQQLGGLPLIGNFIASLVEATQEQLLRRTPFIPR